MNILKKVFMWILLIVGGIIALLLLAKFVVPSLPVSMGSGSASLSPDAINALLLFGVAVLVIGGLYLLKNKKVGWAIVLVLIAAVIALLVWMYGVEGLQNRLTLAGDTSPEVLSRPAKWAVLVLFGIATLVATLKSDLSFGEKAAALGAWALVFLIIGPHLVRADWPNTPAAAYTAPAYTIPAAYTPPAGAYSSCQETSTKLVGNRGAEINPYAGPTGKRCSSRFVIEGNRGCVNVKRYGREYWEPHEFCADRPNVSLPRDVQFIRSTTGPLTVHVKLVPAVIN